MRNTYIKKGEWNTKEGKKKKGSYGQARDGGRDGDGETERCRES